MERTQTERREVHYSGWVQGVGFRYTVRQLAVGRPVSGFVRNLPDGRVELVVEGAPEALNEFLDAVRRQFETYITRIDAESCPATGEFDEFRIRH